MKITNHQSECNCDLTNKTLVKRVFSNGSLNCAAVCFNCGYISGGVKKPVGFDRLPLLDDNLIEKVKSARFKNSRDYFFSIYSVYLKSDKWKENRLFILEASNFTCDDCQLPATDVHHLAYGFIESGVYLEAFNDLASSLDFLVPLCHKCHEKRHGRKF